MSATHGSANGGSARGLIARSSHGGGGLAVRTEIAPPRLATAAGLGSHAAIGNLWMLAEVVLPAHAGAPGAARVVIAHCLAGLVSSRVVDNARLLGSELVCNSPQHAHLRRGDPVFVRVLIGADALRVEIENPGTVGAVAPRPPNDGSAGGFGLQLVELLAARWGVRRTHSTSVWFELERT